MSLTDEQIASTMPRTAPYTLNEYAEFYWEIVRDGMVVQAVKKAADDANREAVVNFVAVLNREWRKGQQHIDQPSGVRPMTADESRAVSIAVERAKGKVK